MGVRDVVFLGRCLGRTSAWSGADEDEDERGTAMSWGEDDSAED